MDEENTELLGRNLAKEDYDNQEEVEEYDDDSDDHEGKKLKENDEEVEEEDGSKHFALIPPKQTCFFLSISYLLVISSFLALQNLQTSLNNQDNVGVTLLTILYCTQALSALLGPLLVRILGVKNTIILCWGTLTLYIVSNFHLTPTVVVASSILTGVGLGSLNLAKGLYLTAASKSHIYYKKLPQHRFYAVLSMFNGIYFAFYMVSQITGNYLASAFFFQSGYDNSRLENNSCGAWVCGSAAQNETVIERPESKWVFMLFGVFTLCGVAGILITAVFLPRLDNCAGHNGSIMASAFSSLKLMTSWRFGSVGLLFMAQSMSMTTVFTGFTKNFISCSIGIKWLGFAMMCFGATGTVSAVVGNAFTRYVGRGSLILTFIVIDVGTTVFMLMWTPRHDSAVATFFLVPALAGVSGGIGQPQLNAFVTFVFESKEVAAFASVNFLRSVGFALSVGVSEWLCLYHRFLCVLIVYAFALLGYLALEVNMYFEKRRIGL